MVIYSIICNNDISLHEKITKPSIEYSNKVNGSIKMRNVRMIQGYSYCNTVASRQQSSDVGDKFGLVKSCHQQTLPTSI